MDALESWLKRLHSHQHSSLLLRTGMPPQYASQGDDFIDEDAPPLTPGDVHQIASYFFQSLVNKEPTSNFPFTLPGVGSFRVQMIQQRELPCIIVHARDLIIPTLPDLGCDEESIDSTLQQGACTLVCGTNTHSRTFALSAYAGRISTVHPLLICRQRTFEAPSQVTVCEVGIDCSSYAQALDEARFCAADIIITDDLPTPESAVAFLHLWELGCCVVAAIPTPDGPAAPNMTRSFMARLPRPARLRGATAFEQRLFYVWNDSVVQVETGELDWRDWL